MGACATSKQCASLRKEAIALQEKYEQLLAEISEVRAAVINRFAKTDEEKQQRLAEFRFSSDFDLASCYYPGMKQRLAQPEEILTLKRIANTFSTIETRIDENDSNLAEFLESHATKNKQVRQSLYLRSRIYEYFYADLELTTDLADNDAVPNEII